MIVKKTKNLRNHKTTKQPIHCTFIIKMVTKKKRKHLRNLHTNRVNVGGYRKLNRLLAKQQKDKKCPSTTDDTCTTTDGDGTCENNFINITSDQLKMLESKWEEDDNSYDLARNLNDAVLLYYVNSGCTRFDEHLCYSADHDGSNVDVRKLIEEIKQEKLTELELKETITKYFKAYDFNWSLMACGACGIRRYNWSGEGLQVAGKKQPIPCRQGFPPGGLPAGACSGPDTRGINARLTLFCDGLPAGPPGGLPAGACSGLDTRGIRLGSHCFVMASRRALRGRLQRARRTREVSRVGRRKKRTKT